MEKECQKVGWNAAFKMAQCLHSKGRSCETERSSACQDAVLLYTWVRVQVNISTYIHTDAEISLMQCALQLLCHKQMGSTVWVPGCRIYFWHANFLWFSFLFAVIFKFGIRVQTTYLHTIAPFFPPEEPYSSSHCYKERKDFVRCWNAASLWLKINILEIANVGNCMLLDLGAPCKAGGSLLGSVYIPEPSRLGLTHWPWSQTLWQTVCPSCWWKTSMAYAFSCAVPGHHLWECCLHSSCKGS